MRVSGANVVTGHKWMGRDMSIKLANTNGGLWVEIGIDNNRIGVLDVRRWIAVKDRVTEPIAIILYLQ